MIEGLPAGGAIAGLLRAARIGVLEFAADRLPPTAGTWQNGTRIEATVVARLPDGRALLDIDGARVEARLPPGTDGEPGARIQLTVLRHATELRLVAQPTAAPDAAEGATASTRVSLSALADALATVLATRADPDAAPELDATGWLRPLLPGPTVDPMRLRDALREGLQRSGLFYESHQAEWVEGRRDGATLREEPQSRMQATHGDAPGARAASAALPPSAPAVPMSAVTGAADQVQGAVAAGAAASPLATLVDRQLDAVGTRQIAWSGPLWPGQTLDWRIEERVDADAHAEGGVAGTGTAVWSSRLRLNLPHLGEVDARIDLSGGAVRLAIDADAFGAGAMRSGQAALRDALQARGLPVVDLRIGVLGVR